MQDHTLPLARIISQGEALLANPAAGSIFALTGGDVLDELSRAVRERPWEPRDT
jgi:hypothetical protein